MRVWTTLELFRLTRAELFRLYAEIVTAMADMSESSFRYGIALGNLRRIRAVLARLAPTPD